MLKFRLAEFVCIRLVVTVMHIEEAKMHLNEYQCSLILVQKVFRLRED